MGPSGFPGYPTPLYVGSLPDFLLGIMLLILKPNTHRQFIFQALRRKHYKPNNKLIAVFKDGSPNSTCKKNC